MKWQWVAVVAGAMCLFNFCLMGFDKRRAKNGGWRVQEKTFFLVGLLGGALGGWLGMYTFHHKTKHWYFKFGMPLILLLQIAGTVWFLWK